MEKYGAVCVFGENPFAWSSRRSVARLVRWSISRLAGQSCRPNKNIRRNKNIMFTNKPPLSVGMLACAILITVRAAWAGPDDDRSHSKVKPHAKTPSGVGKSRTKTRVPSRKRGGGSGSAHKKTEACDKPWCEGVSRETMDSAQRLFAEGARLHRQLDHAKAVGKYRGALNHWDHPDIHFNLTRAWISLKRPLKAHESLLAAIRWGPISLPPDDWDTAQEYRSLLEGQLARIVVTCAVPGAQVSMGEKKLFLGPGTHEELVLPRAYRIRAQKDGHLDAEEWLQVNPRERRAITLNPVPRAERVATKVTCREEGATVFLNDEEIMRCPAEHSASLIPEVPYTLTITRPGRITTQRSILPKAGRELEVALVTTTVRPVETRRRWARWKPWAVVGAGGAVGVAGGMFQWRAAKNIDKYDRAVTGLCGKAGCLSEDVPDLAAQKSRARMQNRLGVGLMITSGLTVVTGVALAFINQPRSFRRADPARIPGKSTRFSVASEVTGDTIGIAVRTVF